MAAPRTYRTSSHSSAWPDRAPLPGWSNSSRMPAGVYLDPSMFVDIENYLIAMERSRQAFRYGMNALAMLLSLKNLEYAKEKSRGFVDPTGRNTRQAWKIPVRRISGAYFAAWKVRRLAPGVWQLYNDSREAYYIEFGIHTSGRRVRRPIRKITLIKTLRWADTWRVGHRVWEGIFGPLDDRPGRGGRGRLLVQQSPQSGRVMPQLWSPRA